MQKLGIKPSSTPGAGPWEPSTGLSSRIRIAVSSCLLGNRVRYDGGHELNTFITDSLGQAFEFVPVCPEVGVGMGIPRPPIELVGDPERSRAIVIDDNRLDVTAPLAAYGRRMAGELKGVSGYIFKSRSPSCGTYGVKVLTNANRRAKNGIGVFARELMSQMPVLPIADEGELASHEIRDNFLERIFAYRRWQDLITSGLTRDKLGGFHAAHKLTMIARSNRRYLDLGELLARGESQPMTELGGKYISLFMNALMRRVTRRGHAHVLTHAMLSLDHKLGTNDRRKLHESVEGYRFGQLPLIAPVALLRRLLRNDPDSEFTDQAYLHPCPQESKLRYEV